MQNTSMIEIPPRSPWPKNFPRVEIVADTPVVQGHTAYLRAKQGDIEAALRLVRDLLGDNLILHLRKTHQADDPLLTAVQAVEGISVNVIPQAMAAWLARKTGFSLEDSLVQLNKVSHTKSSGWHRLANQALFGGEVIPQKRYLLLDDFIGQGGTLANLRAFIEANGGCVVGAAALTGKAYSSILALTNETLIMLRSKHGHFENEWRKRFGFGFDCLTESEARYLLRAEDADTIRNRLAAAAQKSGT